MLSLSAAVVLSLLLAAPVTGREKRPLTFVDLMQLREIEQPSISADGRWIAFTAEPDRGDPEVVVRSTRGDRRSLPDRVHSSEFVSGSRPETS
jgi:Tol biopolymer transport system component